MDNTQPAQAPRRGGRQRSPALDRAILEAALGLFADVGLTGLSIEAVAQRAGVARTTVYRRWPTTEAILKDALGQLRREGDFPDTGSLRGDLLAFTTGARDLFQQNPVMSRLATKIMAEYQTNPEVYHAFHAALAAPRLALFRRMITLAQARGELRMDLDETLLLCLIYTSLIYGTLVVEMIEPDAGRVWEPEAVVDALLRGIGAIGVRAEA